MAKTGPNGDEFSAEPDKLPPLHNVMQPRAVPEVPPGCEVRPPDFVGVGAMKSGTTWWWTLLTSHPDIASPRASTVSAGGQSRYALNEQLYGSKEMHFFDHYGRVESIDPADYHRYFPRPPGYLAGEWTPRYMYDYWTPPMLRLVAPDTKLLVLLRDPIERFASAVSHHVTWGNELDSNAADHQFRRGLYWQQLRQLTTYFGREQILILQYERCVAHTRRELNSTFSFLGVDPNKWDRNGADVGRIGPEHPRPDLDQATLEALRHAYAPDLAQLLAEFPELDGSLWPTLSR